MNQPHPINIEKDKQQFFTANLDDLLEQLFSLKENSCLQIIYNPTNFFVHFNRGKLIYATNSLAPFERLERHLRRLSNQNSKLSNEVIKQPRLRFRNDLQTYTQFPSDYQGIIWLAEQGYLDSQEAITLLRRITREVFESLLCLPDNCQYRFLPRSQQITELCQFDIQAYITQCEKRLEAWQAFSEKIWSSYQRPYLVTEKTRAIGDLTAEQNQNICQLLKGLNFRQISAILDLDELVVAKILYPSMLDNTIVVRDPKPPFNQLPKLPPKKDLNLTLESTWRSDDSGFQVNSNSKQTVHVLENNWNIACVDDSKLIQDNLEQNLDRNLFSILRIQDSLNAFSELIEFKPDLILLDVDMPNLNGYELCSLLRNHHNFKTTPIIMLDEAQGLVNSTRFRIAGATDSLAKPFNRTQLLNMIFKYLH
ncbi:response regulator [Pleurocapsa sp. PCC 7319]|uniref:response regulator n=1 Tax=Pleurocapsa sp. PCC 7319 TaxID=118161 RepID=UPI00034B4712|nr:response regulator [Pleurocapsa sp. PCC 7319]